MLSRRIFQVLLGARPESAILSNFGPKPRLEFGAEGRISGFSAGLLAGLLAGSAFLAPWPGEDSYTPQLIVGYEVPSYAPGLSLGYRVVYADGGDWPMFGHDPGNEGDEDQAAPSNLVAIDSSMALPYN